METGYFGEKLMGYLDQLTWDGMYSRKPLIFLQYGILRQKINGKWDAKTTLKTWV